VAKPLSTASLWVLWAFATLSGLEVAFWVAQPIAGRLLFGFHSTGLDPQGGGLFLISFQLLVSGAALGLAQWLVLRRHLSNVGWWPVASAIGSLAAAPFWVVFALPFGHLLTPPEALVYAVFTGGVTGTLIALAQLTVLREKVARSGLWVAAGCAGYGLGSISIMAISIFLSFPFELNNAVIGGVVCVITGAALVRLLAKQRPGAIPTSAPVRL
jgi:non-ribosomal peptide synthetase component F